MCFDVVFMIIKFKTKAPTKSSDWSKLTEKNNRIKYTKERPKVEANPNDTTYCAHIIMPRFYINSAEKEREDKKKRKHIHTNTLKTLAC